MSDRFRTALVALSLAASVGACGGGDDKTAAPSTTSPTAPPTTAAAPSLDAVFKPIAGYSYVELPESVSREMQEQFESDPAFEEVVVETHARSLTRAGEGVGIVMAIRLDERYAALPGIEEGIVSEFGASSVATRSLTTAGEEVTVSTDDEGTTFVVWVDGTLVLMVIGPNESDLIPATTSLITSNT